MVVRKGVLTYFVNGIPLADTKALPSATGTDFPADVKMGVMLAILMGASVAGDMTLSWVHAYQLRAI